MNRNLMIIEDDGKITPIQIELSYPILEESGEYVCSISITGLLKTPKIIRGIDSFQSVQLAIQFVELLLSASKKMILWPSGERY